MGAKTNILRYDVYTTLQFKLEKHADAIAAAGFAVEPKFQWLSKLLRCNIGRGKITLVQTDMDFNEKDTTVIPLTEVNSIKVLEHS